MLRPLQQAATVPTKNNYKPSMWFNTNAQWKKFTGNNCVSHESVSAGAELDMSMLSIICSPNIYFAKIAVGCTTRIR